MTEQSGHESPNTMPQMPEETEHERVARQQKETQAREGRPEPDVNGPDNGRNK